ncbi:MAG TPA: HAMP domain-containing histidine kinase [Clostridiaceae bacterium]|nr:HAMP domain-containing histidine kinase [Clostridiaceae bacterium]
MLRIKTLRGRTTLFVLVIMLLSGILTTLLGVFLNWLNLLTYPTIWAPIIVLSVSSLLGTLLAHFLANFILKPIKDIARATKEVAKGNFTVQVDDAKTIGEIEMLIKDFNKMVRELASIEMFRSDFISNFSHEFKTPIVSIQGFAKQLQKENISDEKKKKYIEIIAQESENLANLSTNILYLTKLESQNIVTDKTSFSLDEQIRHSVILLEKTWTRKNLQIILDLDPITYHGNKDITEQLWTNLLSNAVNASKENGKIEITAKEKENEIIVSIKDYGVGMTSDVLSRIFDKFYQGDTSRTSSGNGLGLPMVKRIVELCNGKIHVQSEPDRGTTFSITFPKSMG